MAAEKSNLVPHAVIAALFLLAMFGLGFTSMRRPYNLPQSTFDLCVARYATGTLASDEDAWRCGQDQLKGAIAAAGKEYFDEIVGIYKRAEELGAARVAEATVPALKAGRAAFAALPPNEQYRIKGTTRQAYIYTQGLGALSPEERAVVADGSTLLDAAKRDVLIRTLGEKTLADTVRQIVAGKTDQELAAIPGGALAAGLRRRAGTQTIAAMTAKVERAGIDAFNALLPDEKQEIDERGVYDYVCREGFSRLGEIDKAAIGNAAVLTDPAAKSAQIAVVGRELLQPADKAKLPKKTLKDFAADSAKLIDAEGRRIVGQRLAASLKQSRPSLKIQRYAGTVIAWSAARGSVRWRDGTADAARLLGSSAVFQRHGNVWAMVWEGAQ